MMNGRRGAGWRALPYLYSMNAVFLDRDGIINRRIVDGYVRRWDEFEFLPDIFEVLPRVHAAGYLAIVITNQRGIGRGLMAEDDLADIHNRMQELLARRTGHRFDAIYHCPHNHDAACDCRKPLPGMLLRAAAEHAIELPASWMIGNSESDITAGHAAGCRAARVAPTGTQTHAAIIAPTLTAAWLAIETTEQPQNSPPPNS